jgi:hypothetical protein
VAHTGSAEFFSNNPSTDVFSCTHKPQAPASYLWFYYLPNFHHCFPRIKCNASAVQYHLFN